MAITPIEQDRRNNLQREMRRYIDDFQPNWDDFKDMILEEGIRAWEIESPKLPDPIEVPPVIRVEDKRHKNWDLPIDVLKEDTLAVIGEDILSTIFIYRDRMMEIGYPHPPEFRDMASLLGRLENQKVVFFDKDDQGHFINIRATK